MIGSLTVTDKTCSTAYHRRQLLRVKLCKHSRQTIGYWFVRLSAMA